MNENMSENTRALGFLPPLGWNSWNTFTWDINESLIFEIADCMVKDGYKDAGYEYLVIDDCWSLKERDENGHLVADPKKFPHGMRAVADYIHDKVQPLFHLQFLSLSYPLQFPYHRIGLILTLLLKQSRYSKFLYYVRIQSVL